jgi:hypothetical protein
MPTSHYHSVQGRIAAFEPRPPVQCYEHAVLGDLLRLTTKARTWNLDLWGRFIVLEIASQELVISCFSLEGLEPLKKGSSRNPELMTGSA